MEKLKTKGIVICKPDVGIAINKFSRSLEKHVKIDSNLVLVPQKLKEA